jgi:hypothetical protein
MFIVSQQSHDIQQFCILQDTERLVLWSRRFATRSPLAAAARNTFPRQLQTNFESFPNNCCISRDCRLTGYFIINMWKCYLLFELFCILNTNLDELTATCKSACTPGINGQVIFNSNKFQIPNG